LLLFPDDDLCAPQFLPVFITFANVASSAEQTMHIQLGSVHVTAKTDGGISFYPTSSSLPIYPIFSIEAFYSHSSMLAPLDGHSIPIFHVLIS
jgi:hypothetical protein